MILSLGDLRNIRRDLLLILPDRNFVVSIAKVINLSILVNVTDYVNS